MHEETPSASSPPSGKRRNRVIAIQVAPGADLPPLEREAVHAAVRDQSHKPGGLIEVLHAVQALLGCVPPRTVPLIAFELNLTRAEVHGVISFYHDFREQPPGQRVVKLCRAEACQAVGARALETHLREQLGITDPTRVFHSFRHSWEDAADAADMQQSHRRVLAGRSANGDSQAAYGAGPALPALLESLSKIDPAAG